MPVIPPPALALAAAVVQQRIAPAARVTPARAVATGVVGAASGALLSDTIRRFRQRHTTVEPFRPDAATALVTDGPNALTRNPMYVGMAGALLAHAMARGDVRTLLPLAAFVAIIDRVQIRPEEEALRRLFGQDYADYCARVPRWIAVPGR